MPEEGISVVHGRGFGVNTATRTDELRRLQWRPVDWINRNLRVDKSKTDAGPAQAIALNADAFKAILEW